MSKHGFQAQAEVRFIAVDDIMFNCCSHNEFISVTIKREVIATSAVARQEIVLFLLFILSKTHIVGKVGITDYYQYLCY